MHRFSQYRLRLQLQRSISFFGWGICSGLALPALLLVGLIVTHWSAPSEHELLREADRTAWVDENWDGAIQQYAFLLEEYPGGATGSKAYLGIAQALEAKGLSGAEVAAAYEAAERLSVDRDDVGLWMMQAGEHWLLDGEDVKAERSFERVVNAELVQSADAQFALGRLKLSQGKVDSALTHFQTLSLVDNAEKAALGRFGISISYERLGDLDSAIAELDLEEVSSERLERLHERRSAFGR